MAALRLALPLGATALVAFVASLRRLLRSLSGLQRLLGLTEVKLSSLRFATPNLKVPENVRGVWWIDGGPGVITVDLNLLLPAGSSSSFYAQDVIPDYQTVSSNLPGLQLFLFAIALCVRSHVVVDSDGPQVSWSLLRGCVPLPVKSPSRRLGEHSVQRSIVNSSSGKVLASYPAFRIVDATGQRTIHFQEMIDKVGDVALVKQSAAVHQSLVMDLRQHQGCNASGVLRSLL
ncbi:unnamed protein product [Polarella glacialis]|uniref:Uncharacterized protein n=1 Tax=Polarella glacialis TaxID=89957 RepID=A0A813KEF9_POLGL|nr:unnamed protein product [Polarella glacialis]